MTKQEFIDKAFLAFIAGGADYQGKEDELWQEAERLYKGRPATVKAAADRKKRREEGRPAIGTFVKPSKEEIDAYIKTYTNGVMFTTGEKFIAYWEARGWQMTKGVTMKDWKATVRNWFSMHKERNPQQFKDEVKKSPTRRRI